MDDPEGAMPPQPEEAFPGASAEQLEELLGAMANSTIVPNTQAEVDALGPTPLVRPKPETELERLTQFSEQGFLNQSYSKAKIVVHSMKLEKENRESAKKITALEKAVTNSNIDHLTGLPNRRLLTRDYEGMQRSHRQDNLRTPPVDGAYLLLMDVDNFKGVNIHYGLAGGDRALKAFAEIINTSVRDRDIKARYGGEEFVVVLPRISDEKALEIANTIVERARNSTGFPTTVSIGLRKITDFSRSLEDVVADANLALDKAKKSGKDVVVDFANLGTTSKHHPLSA